MTALLPEAFDRLPRRPLHALQRRVHRRPARPALPLQAGRLTEVAGCDLVLALRPPRQAQEVEVARVLSAVPRRLEERLLGLGVVAGVERAAPRGVLLLGLQR